MRVPDEVRKCVVFLGITTSQTDSQYTINFKGTAFFVLIPFKEIQDWHHVYLVTAKHVAVRLANGPFWVRVNTKSGGSELLQAEGIRWWYHPTDTSADVAVFPWVPPSSTEYMAVGTGTFFDASKHQSNKIGMGDEVFITGLFAQLHGKERNIPIVRIGNVAMMPDEPVPTREFGDIEAYLIEARSIGGLSGSPVFVRETVQFGAGPFHLLGLMHGHWDVPTDMINASVLEDFSSKGSVNMGIAIVVPARKIREVLDQEGLAKEREVLEATKKAELAASSLTASPPLSRT